MSPKREPDEARWDRWSNPDDDRVRLDPPLGVQELRQLMIFQSYDDKVLAAIAPDVRVANWKAGSVLFEEGSYLDVAFWVVSGAVDVYLENVRGGSDLTIPIFDVRVTPPRDGRPGARVGGDAEAGRTVLQNQVEKQTRDRSVTLLTAMDFDLPRGTPPKRLGAGEFFGEIGALNGWPQSVTARTAMDSRLVQIRVPAITLMKKKSAALKQQIDTIYRRRSLSAQLRRTPLLAECDDAFLEALAQTVNLVSLGPKEELVRQGEPVDAMYLVRSGFLRLAQNVAAGDAAVSYLSKGMTLGEAELLLSPSPGWLWTASSVANTELVQIARPDFEALLRRHPAMESRLWQVATARIKETGYARRNAGRAEFIDSAIGQGLVEGTSILVIDLDLCTRCDDCVRACAATHDNVPRFVREGNKYANLLITRACFHCMDPVCLIGCPTGAIHRADVREIVEITEDLCIGCRSCYSKCPYDAITMYETTEKWPEDHPKHGQNKQVATKCDQCLQAGEDPACVRSCPQGCAVRVGSPDEFQQLVVRGTERV